MELTLQRFLNKRYQLKKEILHIVIKFQVNSTCFHAREASVNFSGKWKKKEQIGASRRGHISPVLCVLHWLPVKQRVDYKLATLVYKSLRGQAPSYLVDDCQLIADSGRPQLRSAHANILTVPRTNTRLGDRSFSVAGLRIWNSLPTSLWQPDIESGHFKRLLKAFRFGETAVH